MSTSDEWLVSKQVMDANYDVSHRRVAGLEPRQMVGPIIRSLRQTLAAILSGVDLKKVEEEAFSLLVHQDFSVELKHLGRSIQVLSNDVGDIAWPAYQMFERAGVCLGPGQVILLDPELVRELVNLELSINGQAQTEFQFKKEKLLLASKALDSLESENALWTVFRNGASSIRVA